VKKYNNIGEAFLDLFAVTGGEFGVNRHRTYSPEKGVSEHWVVSYGTYMGWLQESSVDLFDALEKALSKIESIEKNVLGEKK
jgi:hypothetical protein